MVCGSCGLNFHVKNMPSKVKGICDKCGGVLYQRTDDREETVRNRLKVYKNEVSSLISHYEEKKKLHRLSADGDPEIVLKQIVSLSKLCNDPLKV